MIPLAACSDGQQSGTRDDNEVPAIEESVEVTHTQSAILEGTAWQTAVHKYVTDREGPKIAIVGGIHGDEKAGWTAGLQLVDMFNENTKGICGEILLIPQANIQADNLGERYQGSKTAKSGIGTVDGVKYSDLNRSFPTGRANNAQESTIGISDAIRTVIEQFEPDVVVDLHESLNSWTEQDVTSRSLGDTLIFKNKSLFMDDLMYYYNKVYKSDGEVDFAPNPSSVAGSFNYYFTNLYTDKIVFTIETARGNTTGVDTVPLEKRVHQHINILEALFDLVWERVDTTGIL